MSVWDIVQQFTSQEFVLTVFDEYTEKVLFEDLAWKVKHDPVGDLLVTSIDPPFKGWHITLNVDTSENDYLTLESVVLEEY